MCVVVQSLASFSFEKTTFFFPTDYCYLFSTEALDVGAETDSANGNAGRPHPTR